MAVIYKLPSSKKMNSRRWRAQVRKSGKQVSKTFTTKGQAENWARRIEMAIEDGTFSKSETSNCITLSEALARYEAEFTITKKGAKEEHYKIRSLQKSKLATLSLNVITSENIEEFRDELLGNTRNLKGETVRKYLSILSDLFTKAKRVWKYDVLNPMVDVEYPKPSKSRERRFENDEEAQILEIADAHRNPEFAAIIRLAISTSMRQSEILNLKWENVDIKRQVAYLPDGKKGARDVPLSKEACKILKNFGVKEKGVLFHYTSSGLRSAWRRLKYKIEIKDFWFHDIRHEATSRLFEGEMKLNVMEAAAVTGHKDLKSLKRYTHIRAEDLAKKLG